MELLTKLIIILLLYFSMYFPLLEIFYFCMVSSIYLYVFLFQLERLLFHTCSSIDQVVMNSLNFSGHVWIFSLFMKDIFALCRILVKFYYSFIILNISFYFIPVFKVSAKKICLLNWGFYTLWVIFLLLFSKFCLVFGFWQFDHNASCCGSFILILLGVHWAFCIFISMLSKFSSNLVDSWPLLF